MLYTPLDTSVSSPLACPGSLVATQDFLTKKILWQSFVIVLTILVAFGAVISTQLTGTS